jgi:hypothetical protein
MLMVQYVWNGTSGDDDLDASGSTSSVVLRGYDGDDTLRGGFGADRLAGHDGHNLLYGNDGNDFLFVSPNPMQFDTVYGGNGYDTLVVGLTAAQYATPAIRAALSQLDHFIARQASDPTAHFVSEALHLDVAGVEASSVRVEATLKPVNKVVPGALAVFFENDAVSYLGTDYTLGSRWVVDGANFVQGATFAVVERDWNMVGSADFNGDLKADVLWQNTATGAVSVWTMDGDAFLQGNTVLTPPAGSGWEVFGTGDFNGDGRAEILMARTVTDPATNLPYADLSVLTLTADGQGLLSADPIAKADSGWSVAGIGDFDGDGKSDLLWRDAAGHVAVWEMDGATFLRGDTVSVISPDWRVAGTGDFDGDGRSDILWRNTDGRVSIWEMNGLLVKDAATIYNPGADWLVAGIADHNGDGRSDIVWRHAPIAGTDVTEVKVWTMNGLAVTSAGTLAFVPNDWQTI